VLGSVLETGGYTDEIHARIGEKILESGPLSVYLFSREPSILKTKSVLQKDPDDRPDSTQDRILFFESSNPEEIAIKIARDVSTSNNHVFYFKASRMVRMEEVVESVLDLLDRGNCHDSDLQIQHTSF
jgi:UDP-N-acetylmuramyl pentapeptide synthase